MPEKREDLLSEEKLKRILIKAGATLQKGQELIRYGQAQIEVVAELTDWSLEEINNIVGSVLFKEADIEEAQDEDIKTDKASPKRKPKKPKKKA